MEHAFGGVYVNCIYSHACRRYYGCFRCLLCSWRALLRVFLVFVVLMAGITTGVSGVCCAHGGRYYGCFRCLLVCSWRALLQVFPVFVAVLMAGVTTGVSGVCCCAHGGRYYGCFRCLLLSSWRALLRVFQVFVAMFMQCLRCINQLPLFVVFPLSSPFLPHSPTLCCVKSHHGVTACGCNGQRHGPKQTGLSQKASLQYTVTGLCTWELGHNACQTCVVTCTLNLKENQKKNSNLFRFSPLIKMRITTTLVMMKLSPLP